MAKQLVQETLSDTGRTASSDNISEFRNDTAGLIHIRSVSGNAHAIDLADGDEAIIELSKAIAFNSRTNNTSRWSIVLPTLSNESGATLGSVAVSVKDKWARGQLTLRQGESIYLNMLVISGNAGTDMSWQIDYEF